MFGQNSPFAHPLAIRLVTVLLCVVAGGNAQNASTAEWTIGMNLKFFITTSQDTPCPPTLQAANMSSANMSSAQVLPIISSTAVSAGGSLKNSTGSTSFRLTNGWLKQAPFDFSSQTTIAAAEPNAVGGGCWFSDSNNVVVIAPCGTDRCFQFYIHMANMAGPYSLYSCNITQLASRGATGGPIAADRNTNQPNFCLYDVLTGLPVVPPTTNYHFEMSQITNLTGVSVPPLTAPAVEADLPVCNSNGTDQLGTSDCAIAKAVNGLPPDCETKPDLPECILHLFPAFCGDLPALRTGIGNASEELESCLRAVSQGPCVANPGGAACVSGLFPGISFDAGGGGSSGKMDVSSFLHGTGSFFIGFFKSLINSAGGTFEFMLELDSNKVVCMALSKINAHKFSENVATEIHDYCKYYLFKKPGIIKPLEYENKLEHAAGIVADIALLVIPAAELAMEIKAADFLDGLLAKFTAKSAKEVMAEGEFLEAPTVNGDVVQIFKDKGDGTPAGLFGSLDSESLMESMRETGFRNCVEAAPQARLARRGPKKKLICDLAPLVVEKPNSEWAGPSSSKKLKPAIPPESRAVGDLIEVPGIEDAEKALLKKLGDEFTAFYTTLKPSEVAADDITTAFFNARSRSVNQKLIAQTARDMYGLRDDEIYAIRRWMLQFEINVPELKSGLTQMDGAVTSALRVTQLYPDQIAMLETAGPGIESGGLPGIYELEDLCENRNSMLVSGSQNIGPSPKVMAAHLGMRIQYDTSANYMFVIQSKTGRYTTPAIWDVGGMEDEVDFIDGIAGQFKLLGRHELNGGAAAREAGKPGPYAVFYFEEINPPELNPPPRICGSGASPCRAATLTPPTFPS